MQTEKKPVYKTVQFWELVIGAAVLLATVIVLLVVLNRSSSNSEQTEPTETTAQTEPTEQTTVPEETVLPANPIGLGDFKTENGYLTCTAAPSVLGVDVSYWQGYIDWQQVKDAGVEFAIIRAGWRGSEEGVIAADDYVHVNYQNATAAGIKVGAYFFSQAISEAEAVEEAEFMLELVKDWDVQMPIVFDWEIVSGDARNAKLDARTLTDCTKAFCRTIEDAGYEAMIYFNSDQSKNGVYLEELGDYKFWLALYDTVLDYPHRIDMWQYTETGTVPGISGNVDINLFFPWEEESADIS